MYEISQTDIDLLFDIISTPSVSGNEFRLDKRIIDYIENPECKLGSWQPTLDSIGNLILQRFSKKRETNPTLLFACHKDKIGFQVQQIFDNGTLKLETIGGILYARSGTKVLLYKKCPDRCLTGTLQIYNDMRNPRNSGFYAEFGFSTRAEIEDYAEIGDPVSFVGTSEVNGDDITSLYLDNSIGVFTCLKMAELLAHSQLIDFNLAISFNTQEELGLRGIKSVLKRVNPSLTIITDVIDTTPNVIKGSGVALVMSDVGIVLPIELREKLKAIAEASNIPLQLYVMNRTGTSDWEISVTEGFLTIPIGLPTEQIHSLKENASKQDLEYLLNFVLQLKANFLKLIQKE